MIRRWLSRLRATPQPTPPTNVRFETPSGEVIPVECVYRGVEDGRHMWSATAPVGVRVKALCADTIPAKTSISVTCTGGWETS